jgi:hypothetical protein
VIRRAAGCRGGGVSVVVGANLTRFGSDERSSSFCSGLWRLLVRIVSLGEARVEYACSCSVGTISIIMFCSRFPPPRQAVVVGVACGVWTTRWHHCPVR